MSEKYNKVGPERYYVVSESELQDLIQSVYDRQAADDFQFTEVLIQQTISEMNKCLVTCRARPVLQLGLGLWREKGYEDNLDWSKSGEFMG